MKRRLSRPRLASSLTSEITLLLLRSAQFRISCEDGLGALNEGGKTLGVRSFYNVQLELGWHKHNAYKQVFKEIGSWSNSKICLRPSNMVCLFIEIYWI
jgi:hypothetical protein